ncbi:MAG: hypothetical protein ACP5RN_03715 [Armatimonadota bacterium]
MGTEAHHSDKRSLTLVCLLFLASLLLLSWAIFPHLPQQLAMALRERSLQKQQAEIHRLLAHDPKPGQTMPIIANDLLGRPLPKATQRYIAFVGMVNDRHFARVTAWLQQETSDRSAKWVVVGIGKQEDLRKLQEHLGARLRVVRDADGKLHRQWNAVLLPRVYEVDATWRLKRITRPSGGCGGGCGGD